MSENNIARRGLVGVLVKREIRTNAKGGQYAWLRVTHNSSKGKAGESTVMISQYSPSQKEAFVAACNAPMNEKIDVFGAYKDVVVEGKKVGRFFDAVKVGGRPVRAQKQAVAA